jgi:hypothetical protein
VKNFYNKNVSPEDAVFFFYIHIKVPPPLPVRYWRTFEGNVKGTEKMEENLKGKVSTRNEKRKIKVTQVEYTV